MKDKIAMLFLVGVMFAPATAFAHQMCGYIKYFDSRADVERTDDHGSMIRQSTKNTNRTIAAARLRVFEQDGGCQDFEPSCGENDDKYIETVITNLYGYYCVEVDAYDDPYLVSTYDLGVNTGSYIMNIGGPRNPDNTAIGVYSDVYWNITSDITVNWNLSCPRVTSGSCTSGTEDSNLIAFASILAIMAEFKRNVRAWWDGVDLKGEGRAFVNFPNDTAGNCDNSLGSTTSHSTICTQFRSHAIVSHELGHLLMLRLLDDISPPLASCGTWGWTSFEYEKCATSEGWADFVAAANIWEPWASAPYYPVGSPSQNLDGDTEAGNSSFEECVSNGYWPSRRPGNVTRFFWDLYDTILNDDDGWDDGPGSSNNHSFYTISQTWAAFPSGTANRQSEESDSNGRNIRDFTYYMSGASGERYHNCLSPQDNN